MPTGHTPGPLTVEPKPALAYVPPKDARFFVKKNAAWTAMVATEADAKLYAAAPEMFDLIRSFLSDGEKEIPASRAAVEHARELLARIAGG